MKTIIIIIGLLLTMPLGAHAQTREVISEHYVQRALDVSRSITDDVSYDAGNTGTWYQFQQRLFRTSQLCSGTLYQLRGLSLQANSLAQRSSCFQHDLSSLEQEINNNCMLMSEVVSHGSVFDIALVQFSNTFLLNRYKFLVENALNPDTEDEDWPIFNDKDERQPNLCAFHSSYQDPYELHITPDPDNPDDNGDKERRVLIGCTEEALKIVKPFYALADQSIETYNAIYDKREELLPDSTTNLDVEPLTLEGCRLLPEDAEDNPDITVQELKQWSYISLSPQHNPFLVFPDPVTLLTRFYTSRIKWGIQRELTETAQTSETLKEEYTNNTKSFWSFWDFFSQPNRDRYTDVSGSQAAKDIPVIEGVVTPLYGNDSVIESLKSLQELTQDSSKGLRRFVINLATYLNRTCIDRPCKNRLEYVLKVAFSDNCFPYSNASNISTEALQKCLDDADIDLKL